MLCVSNLTKVYQLYDHPIDRLKEILTHKKRHKDFFALKDVGFTLEKGESLGVVGENGSGKSTLLQLIAGVLTPTKGYVNFCGSVLGLLELGIGFHIEFTGRKNIFLYGDILGLSRPLVKSKLDEIIAFAELGEFIDHPLKAYSTGMRMRLAFSLVATLNPEILIVDEALTVGDSYFQKKCLDRIKEIKQAGHTIIFCSHNTYQIGMFCEKVLWLRQGAVEKYGDALQVLASYEAYQLRKGEQPSHDGRIKNIDAPVHITSLKILNNMPISRGDDLKLRICTEASSSELPFHVALSLKFGTDFGIYATGTHFSGKPPIQGLRREIIVTYPKIPLLGGYYWFHARIFDDQGIIIYDEKVLLDPELEVRKESNELGFCHLENHWEIN